MSHNKYLEEDESSDSDWDDDIDIHEVVRTGTFQEVKEAIAMDRPRYIALKDEYGRCAIHYAADLNRIKVAVFLIAKQANVNAVDLKDQTALHLAAIKGLTDMCRTLLEFKADIKLRDKNCYTSLHHAVEGNYFDTATLLVKRGVDLNAEDYRYGRTALHIAAEKGLTEMVTMLLIRGADMYASGDQFYSRTPLHLACIEGHTEVVRVLVKRGADVAKLSGFLDKNPLHLACEYNHWECAEILMNKGMDLDVCGNHINGSTALHICAAMNHLAILQILVEKGANIEKMGRFATIGTPLHVACLHGHAHAVNLLIELGADRNARDETAFTPLHVACRAGHYDVVFMLVDLEADRTARADNNKLAFDYVAVPTIKEKLIILGAKVDARIEARLAEERRLEAIELERLRLEAERLERLRLEEEERIRQAILRTANFTKALRSVADISGEMSALLGVAEVYPDQDVNVNIIVPIAEFHDERFQVTESIDYDLDSLTGTVHSHTTVGTSYEVYQLINTLHNSSALTRAALRGFHEVVHALLQWPGININYQDSSGNTALHNAALIGHREIVEELLLAGINLTMLNNEGKVAANVAKTNYLREIIRNPALISNRVRYQNRVLDHLFIQYKCREGMDLNISEANKVNRFLEFDPQNSTPQNNKTLLLENSTTNATESSTTRNIPQLALTEPTHTKSKYYRSPSKVKSKLIQHTQHSQPSPHTAPLVIFTPDNVPPGLGHLFPNSSMVIPAYAVSSEDLPQSISTHSVRTEHGVHGVHYNCTYSTHSSAHPPQTIPVHTGSTTHPTTSPLLPEVTDKYGPVPGAFGGSVGDFFFRTQHLHSAAHINNEKRGNASSSSGMNAHFLDLLTLQRGYTPTAFDTTTEWNEVKDFLWLLSYPYRHRGVSGAPYASACVSGESVVEDTSMHMESNATYYTTSTTATTTDRRQYLYKLALAMNDVQCTFTDTEVFTVFSNPPSGPNSPLKESEKLPLLTPKSQVNNTSSASNSTLHSPVARIKQMLSIEAQLSASNNTQAHATHPAHSSHDALDREIDFSRIPSNISRTDARRLATIAKHCELFVLLVLQLYEPREYTWPNPMHDQNNNHYISQAMRDNVAYMRYWGLVSTDIEAHLTTLVDLGFTACFIDPCQGNETKSKNDHKRVNFADSVHSESGSPHPESHTQTDNYNINNNNTSSGTSTRRLPDLFVNPPRYWRLAVDSMFEVCTFIKHKAELGYPLDTVRAHLWAHMGRQTIQVQRAAVNQLFASNSIAANTNTSDIASINATNAPLSASTPTLQSPPLTLDIAPHTLTSSAAEAVSPSILTYRRWLKDLMLQDYELYFQHQGFRCLSDFIGLTEQDCVEYFPFLKAGDLRRLTRAAPLLTEQMLQH